MIVHTDIEQSSPEWFKIKVGKIGGTLSGPLSSEDPGKEIWNLAGQLDTGEFEQTYVNLAMARGKELEYEGLLALGEEIGEKIERVGWCESSEASYLGFSPDGLFANRIKVAEMKCPNAGTHAMYCNKTEELIKAYKNQVRQPFIVSNLITEVRICSFHPKSHKPLLQVPVFRDYFKEKELIEAKLNMKINYKLAQKYAGNLKF